MHEVRIDLMAYLFGDLLAISPTDLAWILGGSAAVLVLLVALWRPLLAITVHEELARVEGLPVPALRMTLMLLIASRSPNRYAIRSIRTSCMKLSTTRPSESVLGARIPNSVSDANGWRCCSVTSNTANSRQPTVTATVGLTSSRKPSATPSNAAWDRVSPK